MKNDKNYQQASRRASAKLGFYIHLAVYIVVNLALARINFATSTQVLWFLFSLFGWGIGLAIHGAGTFIVNSDLKQKMIRQEMRHLDEAQDTAFQLQEPHYPKAWIDEFSVGGNKDDKATIKRA